jgi:hypothetical protein
VDVEEVFVPAARPSDEKVFDIVDAAFVARFTSDRALVDDVNFDLSTQPIAIFWLRWRNTNAR